MKLAEITMERSLDARLYVANSDQSLLTTSQHSTMSRPTSLAEFCIFHRSIRQNGQMSSRTRVLCRSAVILFASNGAAYRESRYRQRTRKVIFVVVFKVENKFYHLPTVYPFVRLCRIHVRRNTRKLIEFTTNVLFLKRNYVLLRLLRNIF